MKTILLSSIIYLLIFCSQTLLVHADELDEFQVESEFEDSAEKESYMAGQMKDVIESSLPTFDIDETLQELENAIHNHMHEKDENRGCKGDESAEPDETKYFSNSFTSVNQDKDDEYQQLLDIANSHSSRQKRSLYTLFEEDFLSSFRSSHSHVRRCTLFPRLSRKSSWIKCSSIFTKLGVLHWCKITCKYGYRFLKPFPQYELCGKATKYRWSYQLKGLNYPSDKCIPGEVTSTQKPCTTPQCFETAAYYMNKIDFSVHPCDSFFEFACGRWVKETPIPPFRSSYNTYGIIRDRVNHEVAGLLRAPISSDESASVSKAKIFYKSCVNSRLINKLGAKPLLHLLHDELAWPIIDSTWKEEFFNFESTVASLRGKFNNKDILDFSLTKHNGVYTLQSLKGSLPHELAYYEIEILSEKLLDYYALMRDVAVMLGANPVQADFDVTALKAFEKDLTVIKSDEEQSEEYQEMNVDQMAERMPQINWLSLLSKMIEFRPVTGSTTVLVWDENYLKKLIALIERTPKRVVQNFMVWRVVRHRIKNLGDPFLKRLFEHEKVLKGMRALPSRQYKCVHDLMMALKAPTGKLFIDAYFSNKKKKAAEELFEYIRKGFIFLLDTEVNWMDYKTKQYAKLKAMAIKSHIGYNPEIYENITYLNEQTKHLKVRKGDYFGNYVRLLEDVTQKEFAKLGLPYGPSSHPFNARATMVNAYYSPLENAMTLPCGEMQYPFYWGNSYPRVFQFGAIGTILGHEITHGFDNNGRKFDIHGELKNWWTPSSLKQFKKRVKCIEDQYSNYFWKAAGKNLDGINSVQENIADNGGIRESYAGYHLWLQAKNMESEEVEPATGFTNDQMFFIGFANARCAKFTHEAAELDIVENTHSPGRFRIDGSLQNFDKFSKAFNCPVGSYMNPKKKCIIW